MSSRVPLFLPSLGLVLRPGPCARAWPRPCVRPRRRTARGLPFGGPCCEPAPAAPLPGCPLAPLGRVRVDAAAP
eukprot:5709113-Alexandrium_andersonii.AAC.1